MNATRARLLLLLVFLSACTQPDLNARLSAYFQKEFPDQEPGVAVLVMKDTAVIFSGGFGLANITTREAITPNTLFNIGSISKTFVSNTILQLQDEGKLSVEDSLYKYFPDFKHKEIAQRVKIKHLLTHTSGLPDVRPVQQDSVFYLTANDAENWYPITQADSLEFVPGTKYNYSNPSFNALALIIEQVTGNKWQEVVADRTFKPAGMSTSTITDGAHPRSGVSHGYSKIRGAWTEDDYGEEPTFCAAGNGGVWSSVNELRLYELALRNGNILKPALHAEASTIKTFPGWSTDSPPFIGWSWFIGQMPDGRKTVGHTGSQGGFYANYVTLPEEKLLLVILGNRPHDRERIASEVLDLLAR
ncbi:MAG TPA: serine hydrolase domain-containing protein [Cyclobacteriaceae bacterium]|nr:serine hydrolase domain-containing protein [Cyclobacteriaceae bacterium]